MSGEVFKSYIPGRGWVPAVKAGKRTLQGAARNRKILAERNAQYPVPNAAGRRLIRSVDLMGRDKSKVGTIRHYTNDHPVAVQRGWKKGDGTAWADGRGGGVVFADDDLTTRHELAHIRPRRNPHNFSQRMRGNLASGREEGRAEFEAQGFAGPTYPGYKDAPERWRKGYDEVQRNLAAAQARKRVQKSYIPGKGWIPANKVSRYELKYFAQPTGDGKSYRQLRQGFRDEEAKHHFQQFKEYHDYQRDRMKQLEAGNVGINEVKNARTPARRLVLGGYDAAGELGGNVEAAAVKLGGRRGPRYMITRPKASQETLAHELAHLTPKRDSYRMWNVYQDKTPVIHGRQESSGIGAMREEARAEMASGNPKNYYKTAKPEGRRQGYDSAYIAAAADKDRANMLYLGAGSQRDQEKYSTKALDAFREVQDNIHRSQGGKFRGNQYVDEMKRKRRSAGQQIRRFAVENPEPAAIMAGAAALPVVIGAHNARQAWRARKEKKMQVEKMSPREIPAVAGAHWTTKLSLAADRIEPYAAKRRKPIPRPVIDRHLPTVKRVGGKLVQTGRTKAAETLRAVSYDVSSLNDKDKLIREVASGQGKITKGLNMHEGVHSLVSKMGPDPSELHVAGSSNQRRKARLRKLPPDAVRRV